MDSTVTVNVQTLALPLASVAVLVTVVVDPFSDASTVRFAGQVIAGGWLSSTVTVKVQSLRLPLVSVAVVVTVVVPTWNAEPLAGALTRLLTAQLSVAVTMNVTLLAHCSTAAMTVMFGGQAITGG